MKKRNAASVKEVVPSCGDTILSDLWQVIDLCKAAHIILDHASDNLDERTIRGFDGTISAIEAAADRAFDSLLESREVL